MSNIRARINPLSGNEILLSYNKEKKLYEYFDDLLEKYPNRREAEKYFKIFINGYEVDKKHWKYIKPKPSVSVVIALVPGNDQTIGQLAIISAVIAVTVFTPVGPAGFTAGQAFLIRAGVAIGATLLVNSLITPQANAFSFGETSQDEGQTFSIASQSNIFKKYGKVPKVYGKHKMFPIVVANPYTDLELDQRTKELVQYFYCIYDFGLGPAFVEDLRIGDTPINNFLDVVQNDDGGFDVVNARYRFVDPNKPDTDEGVWDEKVNKTFELYKGDVTQSEVSVAINRNRDNDLGSTVADYQAVRNCEANIRSEKQEIVLGFIFPQGLKTFASNGSSGQRNVQILVEFAEDGTEDWRRCDDLNYVDDFEYYEQESSMAKIPQNLWNDTSLNQDFLHELDSTSFYTGVISSNTEITSEVFFSDRYNFLDEDFRYPEGKQNVPDTNIFWPIGNYGFFIRQYGIRKGYTTKILLNIQAPVGCNIFINGQEIGTVTGHTAYMSGYYNHITPAKTSVVLFIDYVRRNFGLNTNTFYYKDHEALGDNIPNNDFNFFEIRVPQDGTKTFYGNQQKPMYGSIRFAPKSKESLKVRVTRIRSYLGYAYQILDNMTWLYLTTKFETQTISTDKRHVFLELKIKATDQLNGAIQDLSGIVTSVLDVYDENTSTWNKELSENPAWIFADILSGEVNKRSIAKSRLDTASLVEWAEYCDEVPTAPSNIDAYINQRFKCGFILDYNATVISLINQVCSSAQASMSVIDGKYGVLIDKQKTNPVQIFTPRNSSNFASNRKYVDIPHALKVKYIEPSSNWEIREKIVYSDGFNELNATTFEDIETFGVTNNEQAYRYGRYMLAQGKLRQENISINVDFEHLVCVRGDYVKITQDVMMVGGVPARVKAVSGNDITIDNKFTTEINIDYGYTFRTKTGEVKTSTMTINSPTTAEVDGDIPEVGDLIVWGEVGEITFDCIVKSIIPSDDLTAQLILVEKNDAIFDAESSDEIPLYNPLISSIKDSESSPPSAVENLAITDNSYDCNGSQYEYFVDMSWSIPLGTVYEVFEVYADFGLGYSIAGYTNNLNYKYIVDAGNLSIEHKFKVLAVSSTGAKISLGQALEVSATPLPKTSAPKNVENFNANITNETLQLDWDLIDDCDADGYLIRFSPSLTATWQSSIPLLEVSKNTSMINFQARVGTYFIKAKDFAGNESADAAQVKTSIPNLFNLNVVEETNDFPTFPGALDKVEDFSGSLILEEAISGGPGVIQYYPDGEYFYENFLDLGDVFTVRLQSLIEAEGYTIDDLMSNWNTLSEVAVLGSVQSSDWNVETYYRARDSMVVMADWTTLDSVATLAAGAEADWMAWRKFTVGDFTGRLFQFKLKLISNVPNVSPRVIDAEIRSDMPDRIESYNNQSAPNTGLTITYSPAFYGPGTTPTIGITQDNAQQGDYYEITNRTLEGFDIQFFDKDDVAVARTFDAMIKGYGRNYTSTI